METYNLDDYKYDYTTGNPAIYVGTYKKYNNGNLYGMWLDLTTFDDADELEAVCRYLHNDETDPEFMVQDYENIPEEWMCEWALPSDDMLGKIMEFSNLDEDEREAYIRFAKAFHNEDFDAFKEAYQGRWGSEEEFAEYIVDECCMLDGAPELLKSYFDYKSYAYDLFIDDYYYDDGYVFRCF